MSTEEKSIEAINLTKTYGSKRAISDLSFEVAKGSIVGFLGPNGAGKSTTMRILCGLTPATSGIARVNNIPVSLYPQKTKRHIGFMPESNPLPEDMRVLEYLDFRGRLKGISGKKLKMRIDEVMEQCGLARTAEKKIIRTLSKGFRQRVGIADCLIAKPEIVIMDEPTIGLDPHQVLTFRNLIKDLKGEMTIILSSHILPEMEAMCDRFIVINRGHIVAQGTSDGLRKEFASKATYNIIFRGDIKAFETFLKTKDPALTFEEKEIEDRFHSISCKTSLPPSFGEEIIEEARRCYDWDLREIARKDANLEDIFIAATHTQAPIEFPKIEVRKRQRTKSMKKAV